MSFHLYRHSDPSPPPQPKTHLTPVEALKFLATHPRTTASRAQMAMDCPDCDAVGAKLSFQPTNYVHGGLRWSTEMIHAAEAHGHPIPDHVMAVLPQVYQKALKTLHQKRDNRICPSCRSALDMSMQGPKDLMCYKCGHLHTVDESDSFMDMLEGSSQPPSAPPASSLQVKAEAPLQETIYFRGHTPRNKFETYLVTLEQIQSIPDARRSISSSIVPCPHCEKEGRTVGVPVGSFGFFSVMWPANLLHNVVVHGAPLLDDVKNVIKTFIRQQHIHAEAARGPPVNPGITMDRGVPPPSRINVLRDPYTHFDPSAHPSSWGESHIH